MAISAEPIRQASKPIHSSFSVAKGLAARPATSSSILIMSSEN